MPVHLSGKNRPEIRPSAPRLFSAPPAMKSKLIGIKAHPDLHVRLRKAALEEGMTMGDLLDSLLDLRDDRLTRRRRAMHSPLHRPEVTEDDDDGDDYEVVDA